MNGKIKWTSDLAYPVESVKCEEQKIMRNIATCNQLRVTISRLLKLKFVPSVHQNQEEYCNL